MLGDSRFPQFWLLAILLSVLAQVAAAKDFEAERNRMVDEEIVGAGIKDPRVIKAMRATPRHAFVDNAGRASAYFDMALPIGHKQTISPPFVVAYMTEQLDPKPTDKVLEIGTGSGYQAAVLSPLVKDVYTIEIVKQLGERAARTLARLKYTNVHAKVGDGYQGWPENAPFDKIIVTCSPEDVPAKLVEQLREGGRMIVPVGERYQQTLYLFQKKDGKLNRVALLPTLFVPMTGKAEDERLVRPDPAHPKINNGSFEELVDPATSDAEPSTAEPQPEEKPESKSKSKPEPAPKSWHYQRQLRVIDAADAPEGKRYITLTNNDPGRNAQALQGMAIDGRKVNSLDVSLWVKSRDLHPGNDDQQPMLSIVFYDENRAQITYTFVGPWRDTFAWQKVSETLQVPPKTREAIVRLSLNGATGELSADDIRIRAGE